MAKRFTDTNKWRKDFIRGLQGAYKLLWVYILDECDHAGIWHVEMDIAEIRIGFKINIEDVKEQFKDHIVEFDKNTKWFIPDFIEFQYGILNPDNRAHKSVLDLLDKYKLKGYIRGLQGCKDKDKDKVKDKVNIPFADFWNLYDKKVDRKKCEPKWDSLKDSDRENIMHYIPEYKTAQPDKSFRKDPVRFLTNRSWENEIIKPEKTKSTGYNPDQWK